MFMWERRTRHSSCVEQCVSSRGVLPSDCCAVVASCALPYRQLIGSMLIPDQRDGCHFISSLHNQVLDASMFMLGVETAREAQMRET